MDLYCTNTSQLTIAQPRELSHQPKCLFFKEKWYKITHIEKEFDFLGFNIRKYREKLLVKPAKEGVKSFLQEIRATIKSLNTAAQAHVILALNQKIRGWANHYKHCVAKKTFKDVDHHIFLALWRWAKRRHKNKSTSWIQKRYFTRIDLRRWRFSAEKREWKGNTPLTLALAFETCIQRHVKIGAEAPIYDLTFKEYFSRRKEKKSRVDKPA